MTTCPSRSPRRQLVCVPNAPISSWPRLHMSPATTTLQRPDLYQQPPCLLAVTSHLPTPRASSYCSSLADSKSLWFYCQGGSQSEGRLAGDMGQRFLRGDVFTGPGGHQKKKEKSSTRWGSSLPSTKAIFLQWHNVSEVEWLCLWCWVEVMSCLDDKKDKCTCWNFCSLAVWLKEEVVYILFCPNNLKKVHASHRN